MKILLTSVSAGTGHVHAAQAVESALNKYFPAIQTRHIDIMDYVPRWFKTFYVGGYSLAADKLPQIWGWIFYGTDKPHLLGQNLMNRFQTWLCARFLKFVAEFQPDLIVTTHFLLPQILPNLIEKGFKVPIHCVVTDFYPHQFWIHPAIKHFFVAQTKTSEKLIQQGIPADNITVSGIPIHAKFSLDVDRRKVLSNLGLEPNVPTLLFLSGGLGFGDLVSTIQSIFHISKKIQIITVAGKNAKLHAKLQTLTMPPNIKALHFGFVTNMQELLSVTDLVISKAGGLTVSECFAKGNAMVTYPVIPGQEEKNCEFVQSVGAGQIARTLTDVSAAIKKILEDPLQLINMKNQSFRYAKPASALTIAEKAASAAQPS